MVFFGQPKNLKFWVYVTKTLGIFDGNGRQSNSENIWLC